MALLAGSASCGSAAVCCVVRWQWLILSQFIGLSSRKRVSDSASTAFSKYSFLLVGVHLLNVHKYLNFRHRVIPAFSTKRQIVVLSIPGVELTADLTSEQGV